MKKFMALYMASGPQFEKMMKDSTPEQRKKGMDAWMKWSEVAGRHIVDLGAPLGKGLRVTKTGAKDVRNELGGYSILQAESKEELTAVLKDHPHFMTPEGYIEVVEILPLPGA